jgi:hypothetical protein
MTAAQAPFLVEGLLIVVAMVLGGFLGRKAQPYGKVKLSFHLFFWLWFSLGYYYVAQGLFGGSWNATEAAVLVMGLALAVQIATGITMLVQKPRAAWLPKAHGVSASVLLLADVVGFFLVAAG